MVNFNDVYMKCAFTKKSIARKFGISASTIIRWCNGKPCKGEKYNEVYDKILKFMQDNPLPEKHPSYGYVTEDQLAQLKSKGICPEYYDLWKQIARQKGGKVSCNG